MGLEWTEHAITCICAKDQDGNRFGMAGPNEMEIIVKFLNFIEQYPYKGQYKYKFITYNGKLFDIPFIIGRLALCERPQDTGAFILEYNHFDIFEFIRKLTKKRIALDTVSKLLGCKSLKTGSGVGAIDLARRGKWKELREYCSDDVDVTEGLYLKLKKIHGV